MEHGRNILRDEHGGQPAYKVMTERAEVRIRDGSEGYLLDAQAWYGGAIDKLWLKSEVEGNWGEAFRNFFSENPREDGLLADWTISGSLTLTCGSCLATWRQAKGCPGAEPSRMSAPLVAAHRVSGKPRSMVLVAGSGQRLVTTLPRV